MAPESRASDARSLLGPDPLAGCADLIQASRMQTALPTADVEARGGSHAPAVQSMFGRIAPTYDTLNRLLSFGIDRRWRHRAIDALMKDLPPEPSVLLDICAGTLDLSRELEQRAPGRQVLALDFTREMLVAGQPKVVAAGLGVADAMRLPIRTGSVAGAICGFGMRNLANTERGIDELYRVLVPQGRAVVLEFFKPTAALTKIFHTVYARGVLPSVGRLISGDRIAYQYLADSMEGFVTRKGFEDSMRKAGFKDVRGVDLLWGIASVVSGVR